MCGQTTYKMHYKLTAFCQRTRHLLMPIHQLAFRPQHLATLCYEIVLGPIAMLIEVAIPLMHLILFAFRPQRYTHIYRIWVARFAYIIRQLPLIVILKLLSFGLVHRRCKQNSYPPFPLKDIGYMPLAGGHRRRNYPL